MSGLKRPRNISFRNPSVGETHRILSKRAYIFPKEYLDSARKMKELDGSLTDQIMTSVERKRRIVGGKLEKQLSTTKDKDFVNCKSFINFNQVKDIKDRKENRHRAKAEAVEERRKRFLAKDTLSKEQYQLLEIMD